MSTTLNTSIEPRFRTVDGLGIRTPTAAARTRRSCCSPAPGRRACTRSRRCGPRSAEHARLFADRPAGVRRIRAPRRPPVAAGDGRVPGPAHRRGGSRAAAHRRAGRRAPSAALFAAAAHPERIASVIVGTGGAAVPIELGEPLRSWVLDPDLDKYRAMDPRAIVNAAVDTIAGGVPDEIRADYLDCYDGDRFVESMRYVRRYPEELPALAELLPEITTPVTIVNGRHDRVVPLANAEFLDERLPNSRLVDHRRRPLRLGGGAGGVRLDHPRLADVSGLADMKRLLITLFAIAALGGGAAFALADSTPIGPLPAGPVATIDVQHGELVALALPQRSAARLAGGAAVRCQCVAPGLGSRRRSIRRARVPRRECRTHDRLDRADEGRRIGEGPRIPAIPCATFTEDETAVVEW